jgi:Transposase DDE domain
MHDTVSAHLLPVVSREQVCAQLTEALTVFPSSAGELAQAAPERRAGRGRPIELQPTHLWLGLLWAVLEGVHGSRALARFLAIPALGRFAPVSLTDSALVQRLQQAGYQPLQTLFGQLGSWLQAWLSPPACELAPFASHIIALDETKLDAVVRHLPGPRQHRLGDPALLAGKLAALFDIRAQRWLRIQYVADALRNCKLEALALVADLPWHSLLLFDLGYFSFPWFDYLTERGFYWISRYREKTCYQLLPGYSQQGVILDAIVWLGSDHGARAGRAVRLVRFGDGQHLRMYLTNVRDPLLLPMGEIARLYARRWDIELAFLTIKELFGLHHWWSSQRPLILQQIAVVLLLAQLVQALRLHIAAQANCDPLDVSLPRLVEQLPHLLRVCPSQPASWPQSCCVESAPSCITNSTQHHVFLREFLLFYLFFPMKLCLFHYACRCSKERSVQFNTVNPD